MPGTDPRRSGNVPSDLSSFIGRRRELAEVKQRLAASRLVTLTGLGGTGKTRLALRFAAEANRAFDDGVWFVDLTQLRDPTLALDAQEPDILAYLVMAAFGLPQQAVQSSSTQQLTDFLADRHTLLVLDNCEHLLPACASLVHTLLRGCRRLRVLTTSREPLTIGGEVLYMVPPLPTPDPSRQLGVAELSQYDPTLPCPRSIAAP
jgi:predicted ATPase